MKKEPIDNLFESLHSEFDFEVPEFGHENRFLKKLNAQNLKQEKRYNYWKPILSMAASLVLCFGLLTWFNMDKETDLASVSPEMAETQYFFTSVISEELSKLNQERRPETEQLINDAMKHMAVLEKNYESLKQNLFDSGEDKRVIYAMISNFQTRIDLLKDVLETIENIKNFKQQDYENYYTI
ncbi:hypothetical protein [Gaetbulibacter saemankumensis]|uniref:hypothetical protein n=1 Tax=Gaetbulibacter saemankumensis TaxID=311208 RepID=UPI00048273F2|nr:hypothetical protein [Gaetbulibacter saemankumensis]